MKRCPGCGAPEGMFDWQPNIGKCFRCQYERNAEPKLIPDWTPELGEAYRRGLPNPRVVAQAAIDGALSRQEKWKRRQGEKWKKHRAEYMRRRRAKNG